MSDSESDDSDTRNTFSTKSKLLLILLVVLFVLLAVVLIIIISVYAVGYEVENAYAIMVDAGSTSSKLSVYRWPDWPFRTNGHISELKNVRLKPGISKYTDKPEDAANTLKPLIQDLVKTYIPSSQQSAARLFLGATAGMRIVDLRQPLQSDAIMTDLRRQLPTFGITVDNVFSDIRIISGNTEGRYAWISANYLANNFGQEDGGSPASPEAMYGALDLGGASTQISFIPAVTGAQEHTGPISLFGANYNLYSYSFLCYGKEVAYERYLAKLLSTVVANFENPVESPCHLTGYTEIIKTKNLFTKPCVTSDLATEFTGSEILPPTGLPAEMTLEGLYSKERCRDTLTSLFPTKVCTKATCSFNDVYQPEQRGKFFAFAGFYFVINFLKFDTQGKDLTRDAVAFKVNEFCSKPWNVVGGENLPSTHGFVSKFCFDGFYIDQLLDRYGFKKPESWKSIEFVEKIGNGSASWAFGYVLDATGKVDSIEPRIYMNSVGFGIGVAVLVIALILLAVGIVCICKRK